MEQSLYEEHALLERDHWWFVSRRNILRALLERWLPDLPEREILDVGCGTGGMLPMLSGFGHVRGIEGEAQAVAHCHESFPGFDVRQGSIPADVLADGSLDLVTAFDVIEHIEDDLAAVGALRAAVRPGGTVLVTTPALACLWSDHDVVNHHFRRYSRRGLIGVVEGAGLTVVHASYFNTLLLPIVALARLAQRTRKPRVAPTSDFTMPPALLNRALTKVMSSETRAVVTRGLPVGVSLVVLAKRPA